MNHPQNIILTTDFSAGARKVYPFAATLAKRFAARIHLVHFARETADRFSGLSNQEHAGSILQTLRHESLQAVFADLPILTNRLDSRIALSLPVFEKQVNADLIITGIRSGQGFEQFFLTRTGEEVLSTASVPVLVYGHASHLEKLEETRCVLVPFSRVAGLDDVLPAVQFLRDHFDCSFRFLFIQPGHAAQHVWFDRWFDGGRKRLDAVKQRFAKLQEGELTDVETELELCHGVPSEEVAARTQDNHLDLVVIGTRGFKYGVAKRIIYRSKCSVLKVPQVSVAQIPY